MTMGEGFNWDGEEYTETSGGDFVDKKVFQKLVVNDVTVFITAIREGTVTYQGKSRDQWIVDFTTDGEDELAKGMDKGIDERDARIRRIQKTLESTGEPLEARFVEVGRRFDIGRPVA